METSRSIIRRSPFYFVLPALFASLVAIFLNSAAVGQLRTSRVRNVKSANPQSIKPIFGKLEGLACLLPGLGPIFSPPQTGPCPGALRVVVRATREGDVKGEVEAKVPVAQANATRNTRLPNPPAVYETVTNKSGHYLISLPPGLYRVETLHDGKILVPLHDGYSGGAALWATIRGNSITHLNIAYPKPPGY